MTNAIALHETRAALVVLAEMRQRIADGIADRHPESSAAHLFALRHSDHEWVALGFAIDALIDRRDELQDLIDASNAVLASVAARRVA